MKMRTLILALGVLSVFLSSSLLAAPRARAETIAPADAKAHVGQTVTVEAAVSDVHTGRSGVTFIDIGGRYPDNTFTAVIFAGDVAKFPNASALDGKTVAISGPVQLYQGRPEIILKSADQLKAK
jgi:DNA/RNA endonuclease YhcR with UshA esterase domain